MDWLDKLRCAESAIKSNPELAIVFEAGTGLNGTDLEMVRKTFPFADHEYLRCLAETGGLQIDMYHLFGSDEEGFTSLSDGWRRWLPIVKEGGIPIGEDPAGDCIVQCKDGSIRLLSREADDTSEGRVLAQSFAEFLSDVLMGSRFTTLFPRGYSSSQENEWTCFLRRQGWLFI